jgi:hypothetical protein
MVVIFDLTKASLEAESIRRECESGVSSRYLDGFTAAVSLRRLPNSVSILMEISRSRSW